jgi:hypothetical protein
LESHLQSLVTYFSAHPHIALSAVFAASLLEAVPIGAFIPLWLLAVGALAGMAGLV